MAIYDKDYVRMAAEQGLDPEVESVDGTGVTPEAPTTEPTAPRRRGRPRRETTTEPAKDGDSEDGDEGDSNDA